jgi:hypothetical protein
MIVTYSKNPTHIATQRIGENWEQAQCETREIEQQWIPAQQLPSQRITCEREREEAKPAEFDPQLWRGICQRVTCFCFSSRN